MQSNKLSGRKSHIENLESRTLLAAAVTEVVAPWLPQTRFLFNQNGYLSNSNTGKPFDTAMAFLKSSVKALGLTAADIASPIVTDNYTDADTGVTHLYLQQTFNNIPIINSNLNVNIARNGRVLSVGGGFVQLNSPNNSASAPLTNTIDAQQAITAVANFAPKGAKGVKVARSAKLYREQVAYSSPQLSLDPIVPALRYVAQPKGLKLTWDFAIRTPDNDHWFNLNVDAVTGTYLSGVDWVDHASYNVYPIPTEGPNDIAAGTLPRTIVNNPADLTVSPYGWHDTNGVAGADFTDTRGNNVYAQEDTNADNTGGTRPDGGAGLNFDNPLDLTQAPSTYQSAAITNLFYWNNLLHDVHARYGFTEVAGNFQQLNYSATGLGNDGVQADAQDGSGTNNANFATPPDGSPGRMQMYIFNSTTPNRDGDLDNQIVVHEYGHGVSNRLTGGPSNSSALSATQSGGMGEGWSDWWGLMLTQKSTDLKTGRYPVGTYVLGQNNTTGAGIRRYPYSFDMAIDPLTFANYNSDASKEVHNTGEIWCTALWDMNWLLVDKYGFSADVTQGYDPAVSGKNGGNNLALQLVMDGLKLQPANPSFTQARDAILQADQVRTGGINKLQIWTAFARRGLGYSAVTASSSATTVTTATDLPPDLLKPRVSTSTPSGASITPISSVDLTFSKAMNPASFSIADDIVSFTGPSSADLLSSITSVSWLNSNSTLRINFAAVSTNGTYQLVVGPQIVSADDGTAMDQNGDGTAGQNPGDRYTAIFAYDALQLAVTSTNPANNSTVSTPFTTLSFSFNETIAPASVGIADLVLSQGTVVSATATGPSSASYTLSGVTTEGTMTVNMAAGAVTDSSGFPGAAYTGTFNLDIGTRALPATTAIGPNGAMIRQTSSTGAIGVGTDTDDFTIQLDPGQLLTVAIKPSTGSLQSRVTITGPGGSVLGSATSSAAGLEALLQSIPVTSAGLYTISVSSVAGTIGSYAVNVRLNSSFESEEHNGATNDTIGTAQPITSGIPISTIGSMGSVLGTLPTATGTAVYSESFETGTLGPAWTVYGDNVYSHTYISTVGGAASGTQALLMDSTTSLNYALNEAIWTVNMTGLSSPTLTFSHNAYSDESEALPTTFSGHYNGDGVAISGDGTNWYTILTNSTPTTWTSVSVNLVTAAASAGITLGANFKIKFQQYDNYPYATDGRGYDAITISTPASQLDYYSIPLNAGQHLSTVITSVGGAGTAVITLVDSLGTTLATGTTAANVLSAISDYIAPAAGTYYVKVTGSSIDYSLTSLIDAAFDLESNAKTTPQALNGRRAAVGSVGSSAGGVASSIRMGLIQDSSPWGYTSNNTIASQLGYTVTLIPSANLSTTNLSAFDLVVLAGNQTTTTYTNVQTNIARIESFVSAGGSYLVNYAAYTSTGAYSYDVMPGAPGFTYANVTGTAVNIVDPTSGLINGPGGTITNISLDGGSSSTHGYTTSALPPNGKAILSTDTASQLVAFDYPFGNGHVVIHTIPVEFYQATGNFGVFHKNLFNFSASFAVPDDDYYQIPATVGGTIVLNTLTPGDGPNEFPNTLNPALDLYDPAGVLVASDDNSNVDGRNAQLAYTATVAGTYTVRVRSSSGSGEYVLSTGDAVTPVLPSQVQENDGTINATIIVTKAPDADLTIALTSSNASRLSVPATVILPAGQTSVNVSMQIIDNLLLDGPESIQVTSSATGYTTGSARVTINDNETAQLTVTLPAQASEGNAPLIGTISATAAPSKDTTILLSSSESTKLTVPASVILPAGQTSVNFNATVIDNTVIDGSKTAVVTATYANWATGTATVAVADNDATITVTLPTSGFEGQVLSTGGTVKIGGTLSTSLVVNLFSNDTTEITVPATVTIPAGSTTATFAVTYVTDALKDGVQTASVTGSAAAITSGSANTLVRDANLDHIVVGTITGPKTAGTAFAATASAYNIENEVITNYTGTAVISATGQAGNLTVSPTSAVFAAGVWTGNITLAIADPTVTLNLTNGSVVGSSNSFAVQAAALSTFAWSTVGPLQASGVPFTQTITAKDAYGNTLSGFNGNVNLSGQIGSTTTATMLGALVHTSTSSGAYTLGYNFTPTSNVTVTHVRSYFGSKVSFWTSTGTLLRSQAVTGTAGTWTETVLASPLTLTAGTSYCISIYNSAGGTTYYRSTAHPNPSFATISNAVFISADAFPTTTETIYYMVDFKGTIGSSTPVSIAPTTASLVNGVWTGDVTVNQGSSGMKLRADDGAGHVGDSNSFVVQAREFSMILPTDMREDDGVITGVLNVTLPPASDLVVQLTSSDPTRLTVPATVTILAGQTSATFPVTAIDNLDLDGQKAVAISASSAGYLPGNGTITIHDNESTKLTVTLPASAREGDGVVAGAINADIAPTQDVTITLTSSKPGRATVPATVVLKAGTTSVPFNLSIVDNALFDGTAPVTITADADNWTGGFKTLSVQDNDNTITVTLPTAAAWEGQTLTNAGTVRIGGTSTVDQIITLSSSDTSELTIPSFVIIPAGQTTATFTLTLPTDGLKDGSQSSTVTANGSGGLTAGTAIQVVHDVDLDHVSFDTITGPKSSGVAFSTTARVYNIANEVISIYSGAGTVSAAGLGGSLAISPTTATFASGVWTGSVTITAIEPAASISAVTSGLTGVSNTFALVGVIPSAPDLVTAYDSGSSNTDNISKLNNSSPASVLQFSVAGTTPGATINLYAGGVKVGSAVATTSTTLVTTDGVTTLPEGYSNITAKQQFNGVESTASTLLPLFIDSIAPVMPVTPDLQASSDTGASSTDNITKNNHPTFDVTTSDGGILRMMVDGVAVASVTQTIAAAGTYPISPMNGFSGFNTPVNLATGTSPTYTTLADLNKDGRSDILVSNQTGLSVSIYLSKTDGTFQAMPTVTLTSTVSQIAVADFNGDTKPDLAARTASTASILLGNGDGTFGTATAYPNSTGSYLEAYDVNVDGKMDLVSTGSSIATCSVLLGNGNGTFQTVINSTTPSTAYGMALGDFNGDLIPDLITCNSSSGVYLNRGNGNGTFASGTLILTVGTNVVDAAAGDFNGDGKLDVVVADNLSPKSVYVLLGNGNLTFQTVKTFAANAGTQVAVADFNGDGKLDVASTDLVSSTSILFGNGDGTLQAPLSLTIGTNVQPFGIATGDINGDGFPDIVTANRNASNATVLIGKPGTYADGVHTFSTTLEDLAGNISTASPTISVKIDNVAPTVTGTAKTTSDSTPSFAGTISEETSAINVTIAGSTYAATNNGDGTWTLADNTITTPLAVNTYPVSINVTDLAGNSSSSSSTLTIVAGASVTGFVVNDGDPQRSMVKSLTLTFDKAVTVPASAISLKLRTPAGPVPVSATLATAQSGADGKTWIITFSGAGLEGGSLADGVYDLLVNGALVTDTFGQPISSSPSYSFHRLFGDSDGDRDTDSVDQTRIRAVQGKPASYIWYFDNDSDGDVDSYDFISARLRFNKVLFS